MVLQRVHKSETAIGFLVSNCLTVSRLENKHPFWKNWSEGCNRVMEFKPALTICFTKT
jgi:hypothetical protein